MSSNVFASLTPLEQVLDFHLARHSVLAANLTNAETPGFTPKDLVFAHNLDAAQQLTCTNERHVSGEATPPGSVLQDDGAPVGPDENGVRLERVMAQISANRVRYETGIELARRRMALLRYAATDGAT